MSLGERVAAVLIGMAVLVPVAFTLAADSGWGHGPGFETSGEAFVVVWVWGAFLFPPFVAAIAGRRAVLWGVLSTLLPALVGLYHGWLVDEYPGGRWNFFWSYQAGTLGLMVGWAFLTSLLVHGIRKRLREDAEQPGRPS